MDPTLLSGLIGTAGLIGAGVIARWQGRGGRRLTDAQRESLTVQTAERVVALVENERVLLTRRVAELESEVQTLKIEYAKRERDLERSRGENAALQAEVGTLRATLAARESELAAAKALLSATPTTITVTGPGSEAS